MSSKLRPLAPQSFPLVKADGTPAQSEYAFELDRLVRTLEASGGSGGVVYGTTAGTAAEGNDARIVGAAQTSDLGTAAFQPSTAFDASGAATAAIAAHVAASDPHPQYLTATEGNAAYQPLDSDLTAWAGKTAPTGAAVGTTDAQTLTNKNLAGAGNTFPTFNQNTTGTAGNGVPTGGTTHQLLVKTSGTNYATTWYNNVDLLAETIYGATGKSTPVNADVLALLDSAASYVAKNVTWSSIKTALSAQFAVGTVSQSSGVPTGAIIETGSNSNGQYVRYADGTQICWFSGTRTDIALTAYGSLYEGDFSVTFPIAFSANPVATLSGCYPSGNRAWGGCVLTTTTTALFSAFDVSARTLGTTFNVSYMAVGRWF